MNFLKKYNYKYITAELLRDRFQQLKRIVLFTAKQNSFSQSLMSFGPSFELLISLY